MRAGQRTPRSAIAKPIRMPHTSIDDAALIGVTIVVPCFNEESGMVHLRDNLRGAKQILGGKYRVFPILIDDGSTDGTWQAMEDTFTDEMDCELVRQGENRGIAATIWNGIQQARTEIVCSMDCDCTYDPRELKKLLPMLTSDVDLVTGSPYHPDGRVVDVPAFRLALSKAAPVLYRRVLRQKLHTYTSCFRVYRRSAVLDLSLKRGGFLGIPELLGRLDLQGSTIVECPTTLSARVRGKSKMRITRTVAGHLWLLAELLALRAKQELFEGRASERKHARAN
jgi:glycosyltransferase involved in cell wall biosynthesis